ncbi:MAG: lysophospholipid acyltransferase family protein [Candidatus Cloacimonadaceae bacterium]|jgi:1-acyl-sn-glycerol-3-phosphate acyltransferase|nr:1-acyl-sn-glycerol-3-phosphate acyltransferase [Candidatus Cloacimonadota bacterium]MDD5624519.1 lysophospholipid acyltransferase family protein [Candidatus Cloacimonadota bacterium]MDY0112311.1 lysophospholipid acyltransferase family protein [Candidatus Syntrophosphaera sp.]
MIFTLIFTLLWKIFYVFFMLATIPLLLILLLGKPFLPPIKYYRLAYYIGKIWGIITIRSTGSKVKITGKELIPQGIPLCFVGNHQNLYDIPALLGYLGRPIGFIAKKELARIPILGQWMRQLPSLFIDRENPRQALQIFKTAIPIIQQGQPFVIFPEGGRSGTPFMRKFHRGSLKLPQMAKATIVPFAIDGSWRIMDEKTLIHPAKINITILPPIYPQDSIYQDNKLLAHHLEKMIAQQLSAYKSQNPTTN